VIVFAGDHVPIGGLESGAAVLAADPDLLAARADADIPNDLAVTTDGSVQIGRSGAGHVRH
jgi:6-phosphogluconate dehydrogenase (decarboxylating)